MAYKHQDQVEVEEPAVIDSHAKQTADSDSGTTGSPRLSQDSHELEYVTAHGETSDDESSLRPSIDLPLTPPCSEVNSDMDTIEVEQSTEEYVVLTLATRFLASHILKALLLSDFSVKAMITSADTHRDIEALFEIDNADKRLHVHEVNPFSLDSWTKFVSNAKYVIHVVTPFSDAQGKRSGNPDDDHMIMPAVRVTENLLRACQASKVQRVVLISSICSIAFSKKKANVNIAYNEDEWEKVEHVHGYSKSVVLSEKRAWEMLKRSQTVFHGDTSQLEFVVLNPAYVMGPIIQGRSTHSMAIIKDIMEGKLRYVPRINIPIVDARDVAAAVIVSLTNQDAVNNRHILWGGSVWLSEIVAILDKEFSRQGYVIRPRMRREPGLCSCFVRPKAISQDHTEHLKLREDMVFMFDNTRMTQVLEIIPRDKEETFLETAYSLVYYNMVSKK